jgi:hypothetical protein
MLINKIVFVVRIIHNMQTQPLGSLQHFLMLQWVVHTVTTRPYIFKVDSSSKVEFAILTLFPIYTVFINIKDVRYSPT